MERRRGIVAIEHAPEDIAALLADLRQVAEERGLARSLPEEPEPKEGSE